MTNYNLKNRKKAPLLQWGLGVVAIVLLLIFGISKIGSLSSKKVFTEYPPLYPDSLALDSAFSENAFTGDSTPADSLSAEGEPIITTDSAKQNGSIPPPVVPAEAPVVDLFKVNTRYGKIDSPTAIAATKADEVLPGGRPKNRDLFEELLLPENADKGYVESFQEYAKAPIVSSRSALMLLSVLGKQVLVSESADDAREMLRGLAESEGIAEILIADRRGSIVYTNQPQRTHTTIEDLLPELGLHADRLFWLQKEGKTITAIPVFHRYGKLGVAVMVTQ